MFRILIFTMIVATLASCANITTVGRRTSLGPIDEKGNRTDSGKAIHLDIKQRLAFVNHINLICTEPSPDALTAIASSIGASAGITGQGQGAATGALSEAAGMAGIRTQSITLMRDALYRMCEAYANGGLSRAQVMSFLARSQDLTAVVLAVEQLTGPVVGNQALLTSQANARASAATASISRALEIEVAHRERLAAQRQARTDERAMLDGEAKVIDGKIEKLSSDLEAARAEETAAGDDSAKKAAAARKIAQIEAEQRKLNDEKIRLTAQIEGIDAELKSLNADIKAIDDRIAALQKKQDEAITDASSGAFTGGSFSTPAGSRNNTDASAVAQAVERIVSKALSKSYVAEGCMAILTADDAGKLPEGLDADRRSKMAQAQLDLRTKCFKLLEQVIAFEAETFAEALVINRGVKAQCVRTWWNNNRKKGREWLQRNSDLARSLAELTRSQPALDKIIKDEKIEC